MTALEQRPLDLGDLGSGQCCREDERRKGVSRRHGASKPEEGGQEMHGVEKLSEGKDARHAEE